MAKAFPSIIPFFADPIPIEAQTFVPGQWAVGGLYYPCTSPLQWLEFPVEKTIKDIRKGRALSLVVTAKQAWTEWHGMTCQRKQGHWAPVAPDPRNYKLQHPCSPQPGMRIDGSMDFIAVQPQTCGFQWFLNGTFRIIRFILQLFNLPSTCFVLVILRIGIKDSIFSRNPSVRRQFMPKRVHDHRTTLESFDPWNKRSLHNKDMAKTWKKTTWNDLEWFGYLYIILYIFCLSTYNLSMPRMSHHSSVAATPLPNRNPSTSHASGVCLFQMFKGQRGDLKNAVPITWCDLWWIHVWYIDGNIWCAMDSININPLYVSIYTPAPWIRHGWYHYDDLLWKFVGSSSVPGWEWLWEKQKPQSFDAILQAVINQLLNFDRFSWPKSSKIYHHLKNIQKLQHLTSDTSDTSEIWACWHPRQCSRVSHPGIPRPTSFFAAAHLGVGDSWWL